MPNRRLCTMLSLKFINYLLVVLCLTGCFSGNVKKDVLANVESGIVNVPEEAAIDFKLAIKHMNANELAKAEMILLKMRNDFPFLSGSYANLGVVYSRQKKWKDAQSILLEGHNKNKNNIKILNQLGFAYRQNGEFKNAEAMYLKAIELMPKESSAYLNVGILYDIYMGYFLKASHYYQTYQAMQSQPDKKIAGWIVDINRRAGIKTQVASQVAP